MLITRWQAPIVPRIEQIKSWFEMEGLEPQEISITANESYQNLRHPFDNVIMVAKGELILNIAGNKLLLREGDKIVIPSNTKHSKEVSGEHECVYVSAQKTY
ncbi:MAG: cupin domain-containing protein [Bdellovibrionales bacterium]|nr:cupin domain-containing protein [Bdellovibrionales bacterium]